MTSYQDMATSGDPPLVLVTGASGYIASHIVKQLLVRGDVRVRGTVRNLKNDKKVTPLREMMPEAKHPLELFEAELTNADSWKEAVKGCSYVYHVASPIPATAPRDENVLVRPAVEGTMNVLTACAEAGTVKRVVLTSSLSAVSIGMYGDTGREYTEEDWSPEEQCPPYEKSKLLAERRAFEFVEKLDDARKFELVTVLPGTAIGPFAHSASDPISVQVVSSVIGGDSPALIRLYLTLVDVRDLAAAHIAAMETPEAAGKRFIVCQSPGMWMQELAEIIAKEFEPQGYKLPSWHIPKPGLWLAKFFNPVLARVYPALGKQFTYKTDKMRDILGIEHRDIKISIIDTCYDLIERGLVQKTTGYRGRTEKSTTALDEQEQVNDETATQHEKEKEQTIESVTTGQKEQEKRGTLEEPSSEESIEDCRHEEDIQERAKSQVGDEKEDGEEIGGETVAEKVNEQQPSTADDTIPDDQKAT